MLFCNYIRRYQLAAWLANCFKAPSYRAKSSRRRWHVSFRVGAAPQSHRIILLRLF